MWACFHHQGPPGEKMFSVSLHGYNTGGAGKFGSKERQGVQQCSTPPFLLPTPFQGARDATQAKFQRHFTAAIPLGGESFPARRAIGSFAPVLSCTSFNLQYLHCALYFVTYCRVKKNALRPCTVLSVEKTTTTKKTVKKTRQDQNSAFAPKRN